MNTKEILVIGAGIAGCAVALALAKRGISIAIMTSPYDQRAYHAPFIRQENLDEKVFELQSEKEEKLGCSRAYEQLVALSKESIHELLEPHVLVDRFGNIDIHRCLQDQLEKLPQVEWISNHSVIELITLDHHSHKKADRYKKPSCLGVIAYHHETHKVEYFLAKETILATGGASSLFPYSTHPSSAWGSGLAIAHRAGARLLNMEQIQFHPLALYEQERPCFPLPLGLLAEGGKIYANKAHPFEVDISSPRLLLEQLYDQLLKNRSEHLWLDLTLINHEALKEKFPTVDIYCLNHGFNLVKDPLPVVPAAAHTCGGIAVDKTAQTSLHRLRAIGEVACTGLFWDFKEESLTVLESLTWATACAEDIAKQANKFIYYFPELREGPALLSTASSLVDEDWKLLKQIMWSYAGIRHDKTHLVRGCALLDQLSSLNTPHEFSSSSFDQIQLTTAIQTAQLIGHAVRGKQGPLAQCFLRFPSIFVAPQRSQANI